MNENKDLHWSGRSNKEAWDYRRNTIFAILIFSAAIIIYCLRLETQSSFHETLITGLLTLDGSLLISWIFGSVLDDRGIRSMFGSNSNHGG